MKFGGLMRDRAEFLIELTELYFWKKNNFVHFWDNIPINVILEDIIDIYGLQFSIYGPPVLFISETQSWD